jgi:hypothetical protein
LIDFAQRGDWATEIIECAMEMAQTTRRQWTVFSEAFRKGELAAPPR